MKKWLSDVSVSSVLIAVVGLILLLMPSLSNRIIVIGISIALLIYGVWRVVRYMRRDTAQDASNQDLLIGLLCAAFGLFMLVYSSAVISILPFLLGLFLIFGGVSSIQTAFDVRRFNGTHWSWHLIIGIIIVILGIMVIRDPFGAAQILTRFVGAALLLLGIYRFLAGRKVDALRTEYRTDDDNIIDQDEVQ